MAQMTVYPPDDLIKTLSRMGNIDRIAPVVLDAGMDPLEKEIKSRAKAHVQTSEMVSSLKRRKSKKGKDGSWRQRAEFTGYDKGRKPTPSDPRGVPNARKAMSLEYGTSNQPATPVIRPAVIASEDECIDKMQEAFTREVQK